MGRGWGGVTYPERHNLSLMFTPTQTLPHRGEGSFPHPIFTSPRYPAGMTSMARIETAADRRAAPRATLTPAPASDEVRVIVSTASGAIDALQPEWTALAEMASEPNAFAEYWFVAASL